MRALIQRVMKASVHIEGRENGSIGKGYLVLLGVGQGDTEHEAELLFNKMHSLRIFEDDAGKTNLSLADVGGELLVVSQFTLYADCKKGRRPSFTNAAPPKQAEHLYEYFVSLACGSIGHVATGEFGAMMEVSLINDGPFTIWLDTDEL